ncbi:hypothetical protein, variant [Aphanomyces invadans]|uniref:MYND-type domain-containing protein n=1 Tax=Aphanomyces invadans TaxID=157072 RepID=A0A024UMR9_9STRA|nr:hypothetical protein, variant [Aphanomyces invadans]ETW07756.1 hypothetical protein, variant [Aphanomyces invadans]|eukprot:XP_008863849.1 hypothetical protein, variant [Aphanomyces invadans]
MTVPSADCGETVVLEDGGVNEGAAFEATNYEDEDDEDVELEGGDMEVELGFLGEKEVHLHGPYGDWDGGKVGGSPVWLHPNTHVDVKCNGCDKSMSFLLQIYCPLDHPDQAFHRSLYLFCCRTSDCARLGHARVFRCQLPQDNLFYANHEDVNYRPLDHVDRSLKRCALCGLKAMFSCSACHVAHYCSKEHQKDHWKHGHKQDCPQCLALQELFEDVEHATTLEDNGSKYLFPEYAIHIDPEPASSVAQNTTEAKMMEAFERGMASTNQDLAQLQCVMQPNLPDGSPRTKTRTCLRTTRRLIFRKRICRHCWGRLRQSTRRTWPF